MIVSNVLSANGCFNFIWSAVVVNNISPPSQMPANASSQAEFLPSVMYWLFSALSRLLPSSTVHALSWMLCSLACWSFLYFEYCRNAIIDLVSIWPHPIPPERTQQLTVRQKTMSMGLLHCYWLTKIEYIWTAHFYQVSTSATCHRKPTRVSSGSVTSWDKKKTRKTRKDASWQKSVEANSRSLCQRANGTKLPTQRRNEFLLRDGTTGNSEAYELYLLHKDTM